MNAHSNFAMAHVKASKGTSKVSRAELAQFLSSLAEVYKHPRTGNPRLSVALLELADQISPPRRHASALAAPKIHQLTLGQDSTTWLRGLELDSVKRFIADEAKSKNDLIELASERFSIPRSKLMRLPVQGVREEILSALRHEESIQIISQEAERSGNNRNS
jgi:hypothetical protein